MMKERVAHAVASLVGDGQIIGLGSGSTVELAVKHIGQRISSAGLRVRGVPSSNRIAQIASRVGIDVLSPFAEVKLDWAFDGADEIDSAFNLIKGGGGALVGEKILARRASHRFVIIVTPDKFVTHLGEKFAVPVEVLPEAEVDVARELELLGAKEIHVRASSAKYGPTITEHGNIILDVRFQTINFELEKSVKSITGVVESGLFFGYATEVLVPGEQGVRHLIQRNGQIEETIVSTSYTALKNASF